MRLSIIIPVYNEKETIERLITKVQDADLGDVEKEIIIVDDFSKDGTRQILKKYENLYQVFYHDKNYGKGRALRTGFGASSGDWVVVQDADLEYEPSDLKLLVKKAKEPNVFVVYGSRRLNHSYFRRRHSGHIFAIGGIFLTWFTNILFGTDITDESTCYKMFKREFLLKLNLECERFEFCPEVTAKFAKMGLRIHEVPINYNPRHKSEGKKIGFKDAIEAVLTLLKWRFKK